MKHKFSLLPLLLALILLLTSCGSAPSDAVPQPNNPEAPAPAPASAASSAATMRLRKTEGTVDVSDGEGKDVAPMDNLDLYGGYQVGTQAQSYAWIDLDSVKLTKMNENSAVEIIKEGKKLELNVKSGSIFFNVTEPLADDETLEIRTSTMLVGIRGTCGWVTGKSVGLLEGTVTVTAGEQTVTVTAGERAVMTEEGALEVKPVTAASIPAYALEEVLQDSELTGTVRALTGIDLTDPMLPYAAVLEKTERNGQILYKEIIDFEQDGSPELLMIYTDGQNEATGTEFVVFSISRSGPEGITWLCAGRRPWNVGETDEYSLVEYGGRLYLEEHRQDDHSEAWRYIFSVAGEDGSKDSWHGMYVSTNYEEGDYYGGDETGFNEISAAEYEAVHGQFSTVRVLVSVYTPDGNDVTVIPAQPEAGGIVLP